MVFLGVVKPFKSRCLLLLNLLNECVLLSLTLLMLLFESLASRMSESLLSTLGAVMIIALLLLFLINLLPLLFAMLSPLFKRVRYCCCQKKKKKKREASALKYLKSARVRPDCKKMLILAGTDFSLSFALHNNYTESKYPSHLSLKRTREIDRIPSF